MANKVRKRIEEGKCIDCGVSLGQPGDTSRRCAKHARKHNQAQGLRDRKSRAERKRQRKCINCGEKLQPGESGIRCREHQIKNSLNTLEYLKRDARFDAVFDAVSVPDPARRS